MYHFKGDINSVYVQSLDALHSKGKTIVKEGKIIVELYPSIFEITNPENGILSIDGRPYNPAFSVAETYWNLIGDNDKWLTFYNKKYESYFNDGKLKAGYGNRIIYWKKNINQIHKIVKILKSNPLSQHAILIISNPTHDLDQPVFVPCINLIKFKIREGKLIMSTFMRAQDIWLGFPYDIHLLLSIFDVISGILDIPRGSYYHYCDVLRLYQDNIEDSKKISRIFNRENGLIKVGVNNKKDLKELVRFRPFFINPEIKTIKKYLGYSEYWDNSLRTILVYSLIKEKNFKLAEKNLSLITNDWNDQYREWSSFYNKEFYQFIY